MWVLRGRAEYDSVMCFGVVVWVCRWLFSVVDGWVCRMPAILDDAGVDMITMARNEDGAKILECWLMTFTRLRSSRIRSKVKTDHRLSSSIIDGLRGHGRVNSERHVEPGICFLGSPMRHAQMQLCIPRSKFIGPQRLGSNQIRTGLSAAQQTVRTARRSSRQ